MLGRCGAAIAALAVPITIASIARAQERAIEQRIAHATDPDPIAAPSFRARARVSDVAASARRFVPEQIRDVPGAFGDPLRAIESLPGIVPVLSGLPYVFVRGSPPAGTLYVYDGIPLPQLFHLAIGPSVVHPRLLGALQLHAGVAPSQWGRHVGGVILAEGPGDAAPEAPRGEAELRLLDVNGFVLAPLLGGSAAAAVRIGWPDMVASAASPGLEIGYGDYQLRATVPVGTSDRVQLVAIGSSDRLAYRLGEERNVTELQFHRIELRLLRRAGGVELLSALRVGYDKSAFMNESMDLGSMDLGAESLHLAPRLVFGARGSGFVIRAGADAVASFASALARVRVPAHSVSGAWAELALQLDPSVTITAGARFDMWITQHGVEGAIDPRLRAAWRPVAGLALHAGAGISRQPPLFPVPIPGFSDLPLNRGLQTAMQSEIGGSYESGPYRAELQLFVHRYEDIVPSDFSVLFSSTEGCAPFLDLCRSLGARTQGLSWGGEVLLSIAPEEAVSGWISYTLAWAILDPIAGVVLRPGYDVRHVANLVARWELGNGFTLGARIHVRSGAPRGEYWVDFRDPSGTIQRYEQELPAFLRGDAQFAYTWDGGWARFRLVLEWLNVTIADEAVAIRCTRDSSGVIVAPCATDLAPPIFAPNVGLRMDL